MIVIISLKMVQYLEKIDNTKQKHDDDDDSSSNEDLDDTDSSNSPTNKKRYKTLAEQFDTYMKQIQVIGFKSAC